MPDEGYRTLAAATDTVTSDHRLRHAVASGHEAKWFTPSGLNGENLRDLSDCSQITVAWHDRQKPGLSPRNDQFSGITHSVSEPSEKIKAVLPSPFNPDETDPGWEPTVAFAAALGLPRFSRLNRSPRRLLFQDYVSFTGFNGP